VDFVADKVVSGGKDRKVKMCVISRSLTECLLIVNFYIVGRIEHVPNAAAILGKVSRFISSFLHISILFGSCYG
jgi:predicted subunit of tRNA(5-methylaminomethyl-2-thiouridylate) methyltransferase